jgi:hypothetical protein
MTAPRLPQRAAAACSRLRTALLLCLVFLGGASQPGLAVSLLPGDIVAIASTAQGVGEGTGSLIHIDPSSGAQSVLSAGAYLDVGLTHDGRIFAITSSQLVEVQASTGDLRLVRDLTDLGVPTGLAVGPAGALFVAYEDTATRRSGIQAIDPDSGAGSVLSALGSFGRVTDLEFVPGGSIAALAEPPGGDPGELFIQLVDPTTGAPISYPGVIARGSALGASLGGDLVAAAAFGSQGTAARVLVVDTGDVLSLNLPLFANERGTCPFAPDCQDDLIRSDVAFEGSGRVLLSVNGFPGSPAWTTRLFRVEADGSSHAVTDGTFSEVQVATPEPSGRLLLAAGLLALAGWRRSRRAPPAGSAQPA